MTDETTNTETGTDEDGTGDTPSAELTESERKRLRSIVESVLFAVGDPVSLQKIAAAVTGFGRKEIRKSLTDLAREYEEEDRGFRLHEVAGGYQLRTVGANAVYVRKILEQRPVRLTRASLETLAIVAYRQPITRAEVEAIRGVNDAGGVLTTLLERNLIRVTGRKEVVGRPLLYGTAAEFLEVFGLKDLSALPTLDELGESADVLERLAAVAEEASRREEPDEMGREGESDGSDSADPIERTEPSPSRDDPTST